MWVTGNQLSSQLNLLSPASTAASSGNWYFLMGKTCILFHLISEGTTGRVVGRAFCVPFYETRKAKRVPL